MGLTHTHTHIHYFIVEVGAYITFYVEEVMLILYGWYIYYTRTHALRVRVCVCVCSVRGMSERISGRLEVCKSHLDQFQLQGPHLLRARTQ